MRILITTGLFPPDIGGPATYSKFLRDKLPSFGHSVTVLAFRDVRKYWPVVRHIVFFILVLRRGANADVLYAQDTMSVGLPTALANVFLGKKFFVRVPGDHVWEQGTARFGVTGPLESFPLFSWSWHPYLILLRAFQRFVVQAADALIVPSKYMERIVRTWDVDQKKVVLIYNGVEQLEDTGNKAVLRGLLRFQGKLIISIGRLVSWKGFSELIALMPALKKQFPDLKLLIAGGGPLLSKLEEEAGTLGVGDDVIFTGELERDVLLRYIRIADVFVLNSRYEGLSHLMLEVMTVGVPVVATAIGGNPEVIDHERNGYLVPPNDTERLMLHVSALLRDANLRAHIVAAGKRKVKQFSNERMVEETAKLLKRI
jgi:glycosyltransferase involved in cell wall biosynthesis